jgi:hypothetical protein
MGNLTGYTSATYAASLAEFGTARFLPSSGGWLLEGPIPGVRHRDAMGCYPLFCCAEWTGLGADLDALATDLAAVSLVADPFGAYSVADLRAWFVDKCVPFKAHFVADLARSPSQFVTEHHRRYARRALRATTVERCEEPWQHLDEWTALYDTLIERHRLRWIKAFSRRERACEVGCVGPRASFPLGPRAVDGGGADPIVRAGT